MKKIIILGADGMAGHTVTNYLFSLNKYKVLTTVRNDKYIKSTFIVDIEKKIDYLKAIVRCDAPDIVINCIGILVKEANDNPAKAIYINSYFPHWLEEVTKDTKTKIIHLSTDCVFNGKVYGGYTIGNTSNADDWYGKTKAMGEVTNDKDLTIRMSIIGKELKSNGTGLFEWFMRQKGTIQGYTESIWSGMTTLELAKAIENIIENHSSLSGLIQLAPKYNISKYDLLNLINKIWERNIIVEAIEGKKVNKSLINSYKVYTFPESYEQMLKEYKEYLDEK